MDTGNWDPATCPLCNKRCTNWETVHAKCQLKHLRDQRDAWKEAAEGLANLKKDKHGGRCGLTTNNSAGECTCGLHAAWKAMAKARELEKEAE